MREYQTAREFLIDKPNHSGGIVLSEIRLLGMQGTELVEELAGEREVFPIVLLANRIDISKAIQSGVDFLCGALTVETLVAAIERTLHPEPYDERKLRWGFENLTPREMNVLEGLIAGKASRQIAYELKVSAKTVEAHRWRINDKTRARDIGDLIRMWKAWKELQ